jgi:hypothetical protein
MESRGFDLLHEVKSSRKSQYALYRLYPYLKANAHIGIVGREKQTVYAQAIVVIGTEK